MVAALGEQPVDQHGVDPFRSEHRLGDALGRVLIVVQSGGSERQIEVGDDRRHFGQRGESPRQVVSDRRGADAALGADDRDHPPERLRARHAEQLGHRLDEVHDAKRRHQIFADPARDQLAIENDVVELAEDDHLGPGVAKLRQLLELPEQRVAACWSLEHDHVRRRRAPIGFDRGRRAAHVQLDMRLGHSAIGHRGADDGGQIGRFAERLDRYARHRIDLRDRTIGRRPVVDSVAGGKRPHGFTVPRRTCVPIGIEHRVFPLRARVLAVADGLDGSGAHFNVGRPERPRLDEIARIVDLGGNHRLAGAAEVRVGLVLPPFDR